MINGFCFRQSRRKWCVGLASILLPLLIGSPCLAQGQLNSGTLPHLNSRLAEQYPAVRSVVFARHGCVEFEYYRGAVNAQSLLPVHSITKSVLSILIGMALVACALQGGYVGGIVIQWVSAAMRALPKRRAEKSVAAAHRTF